MKVATKVFAAVYAILAVAMEVFLLKLNVLPSKYLIMITTAIAIVSVLVIWGLLSKKKANNKTFKVAMMVISAVLLIGYAAGAAYAYKVDSMINNLGSDTKVETAATVTQEPFNIYISGIDSRDKNSHQGRSDVNMIVTVNPKTHKILLTSIPRDYEIRLVDHDYAMDKLTHTGNYGVETTMSSVEDLLGIKLNYYILVNFDTVADFVEAVGGIDVVSDYDFTTNITRHGESYHFVKGVNHLNGEQALAFSRERYSFVDGDRQRAKNQQIVFEALLDKALNDKSVLKEYAEVMNRLNDEFSMSITSNEIKALIKMQLADMPKWTIEKNSVTGGDSSQDTYSGGKCYVMSRNQESIDHAKAMIDETMSVPEGEDKEDK